MLFFYIGGLIFLVLTFGYYLTTNIPLLFLIRVIQGAGFGIGATASGTIAGHVVPASRRGEGIGYYALSVTLAAAVGPALSIMIYSSLGFG
ncbi:drug resistance MFS transporter, drug:H+ antiporter-2 (14 Spanner) (DHA2) family, partial [Lactococcus lactis subsp. lactis]